MNMCSSSSLSVNIHLTEPLPTAAVVPPTPEVGLVKGDVPSCAVVQCNVVAIKVQMQGIEVAQAGVLAGL
jgi:hypothetical protein